MTSLPRTAILAAGLLLPGTSSSAAMQADTAALQFHAIRAGAELAELDRFVRVRPGSRLRCDRAKRDPRVYDCRGVVKDSAMGGSVDLWISAIDSTAAVITLSATVDSARFARWRGAIETSYGKVRPRTQGSQTMMQWVRRGRMLRLTWRTERGRRTASVSLVDGQVLDAWGKHTAPK